MLNLPTSLQSSLGSWRSTSYGSALCLIVVQVGMGIVRSPFPKDRTQNYSVSACLTISEFFKFFISVCLFWVECRKRKTGYVSAHARLISTSSPNSSNSNMQYQRNEEEVIPNELLLSVSPPSPLTSVTHLMGDEEQFLPHNGQNGADTMRFEGEVTMGWRQFLVYVMSEISTDEMHGFARLALLYALVNNTVCNHSGFQEWH
jgi:hypothetical protein